MLGETLLQYQITDELGAGGMGEVYRATDTRLGREVAIKVLPQEFAADPERVARFEREARVLASLNHPGIAHLYGFESTTLASGTEAHFLVMELVEGEDLAERLRRGPLPAEEAIGIARQMTEALEVAHEKGIVHRDLKPANVKLSPEGTVKVLDFGLARAWSSERADGAAATELSQSPTLAHTATSAGVILGTAAYMSPEQAKGRVVDTRADIWAFGCVLYEMLCGRRAFEGDGVSDTLAAVLRSDIELDRLPPGLPGAVRPLLAACLQREPARRVRHFGDVRLALDGAFSPEAAATGEAPPEPRGRRVLTVLLAAGVGAAAIVLLLIARLPSRGPEPAPVTFSEPPPAGFEFVRAPLPSPDGAALAMLVRDDRGETGIWLRSLDEVAPRPLAGTGSAVELFWSPDGRELAFATPSELRRIDRQGGASRLVAALVVDGNAGGGVWTADGAMIVHVGGRGILRVPASGGAPQTLRGSDDGVQYLSVAPLGAEAIVYRQFGGAAGIYASPLEAGEPTELVHGGRLPASLSRVRFLPPDLLLYRGDTGHLIAQRVDVGRLAAVGEPVAVAEAVQVDGGFEVGASGVVSLLEGPVLQQLAWLDRQGNAVGSLGAPGRYEEVQLSPDGHTLLFVRVEPSTGNRDLWLQGIAEEAPVRFSFDAATDHLAAFSPDGTRLAWESHRAGTLGLYQRPLDGSAPASLIEETGRGGGTQDWSADGRFVLYWFADGTNSGTSLMAVAANGGGEPTAVVEGPFSVREARVSPDGRLLAYRSHETGEGEIYVERLDGLRAAGQKRRVSTGGGRAPRWRADGSELFFLSGRTLMACPMRREGDASIPGTPVPLFELELQSAQHDVPYAVTPEGERFIVIVSATENRALPATVRLNWRPGAAP